jgi:hypothetical protein
LIESDFLVVCYEVSEDFLTVIVGLFLHSAQQPLLVKLLNLYIKICCIIF